MRSVVIWGCGGHAREVNMLCAQIGVAVTGFLDERPEMKGRVVDDVRVLGTLSDVTNLRGQVSIICAGVGDPTLKRRFAQMTTDAGFTIAHPIIHPAVHVSPRNSVGQGSVICAGVVMTINVTIGCHVIVNYNSTLGHDSSVSDYATISPSVNISGRVTVEDGAYLGVNCSIRENIRIGAWSIVGGGAFVRQNVLPKTMWAGVPAALKKTLS